MTLVKIPKPGAIGVIKDISGHELPLAPPPVSIAWTDARNIQFRNGAVLQSLGYGEVYNSPPFAPQHCFPLLIGSARYWIYMTASKSYAVTISGGVATHTDITHLTPRSGTANAWTSTVLGGVPVVCQGDTSAVPMTWDSSSLANKFVNLTAWPANTFCKAIRSYKNYLFALNITKSGTNYPFMLKWSHPADPGALPTSWDIADPTKDAGEVDLPSARSPIVDGLELGNFFIAYTETEIYRGALTGGVFVFSQQRVSSEFGMLNRNCVVEANGAHYIFGSKDIYVFDGQNIQSLLDDVAKFSLFQSIDVNAADKCFVFRNSFLNEIFFCFPQIGSTSCDLALVWNYKDRTASYRELPNVTHAMQGAVDNGLIGNWNQDSAPWDTDLTVWDGPDFTPSTARVMMASANAKFYLLDASSSFDGAAPTAYLERRGISFGAPENIKLIKGVRPIIKGNTGQTVIIKVGYQTDPALDPTWGATMTHTIGSTISNDCLVSGRYLALRIENGTAYQWQMDSLQIDVDQSGFW